jgi:PHP family Zn ribbon phosphoesterase
MSEEYDFKILRCDLHIHSALSPCAENDMTPGNIVGMAKLNGLDIIAVTDHQSCGNCASAIALSDKLDGPLVIPGMEAESAEEIHMLCLFDNIISALDFEKLIRKSQIYQENRTEIFGDQLYFDQNDEVSGCEKQLLLMPGSYSCDELARIVYDMGGACIPAHLDREANSMLSTLGTLPEDLICGWIEISGSGDREMIAQKYPELDRYETITNSDAHRLTEIADPGWLIELPSFNTRQEGRKQLIQRLRKNGLIHCSR